MRRRSLLTVLLVALPQWLHAHCAPHPVPHGFAPAASVYYACDAASSAGALPPAAVAGCAEAYTRVKLAFLSPEEAARYGREAAAGRRELNAKGYRRFKTWERCHPAEAAALRGGGRVPGGVPA